MEDEKIRIELTGNPFVDTGLGVIASLAKLEDINQLTLAHIKSVHGDGSQITEWNSKLKSFSQIFGTNNPLYHPSFGFKKGIGPSENNKFVYKKILEGLLSEIGKVEHGSKCGSKCWSCGNPTSFNFINITNKAVESVGKNPPKEKYLGRDWFPLAGSLGSDAQALPAASVSPHICPKCLFAIHYLPLGLISLDGKLSVFQCTSTDYWYDFLSQIVSEVRAHVQSGDYETIGTKESKSKIIISRLLKWFNELQNENKKFSREITLFIWRFSNSGASPDCSIEEIPNPSLKFLWNATHANLRIEIESLIREENDPRYSLYQCILTKQDYPYLYPMGRRKGASVKLFEMYQMQICGHSAKALKAAKILANEIAKKVSEKELERMKRSESFTEARFRNQVKSIMINMTENGKFSLEDYLDLFSMRGENVNSINYKGWNLIRFYLYHINENDTIEEPAIEKIDIQNPILYYAGSIYNNYIQERGLERFKKEVLEKMKLRKIGNHWLANQFIKLAETNNGFNYYAWSKLCKFDNHINIYEILFQMRLLWTQWAYENRPFVNCATPIYDESIDGLTEHVNSLLKVIFDDYIERKGHDWFHQEILVRLRKDELGLPWFKKKFTTQVSESVRPFTEDEWEDFLIDEEGRSIKSERLFQLHLALSNLYRISKGG